MTLQNKAAPADSRQRILVVLQHKESDRVPIDFGGTDCSSIHVAAYERLKNHLGLSLEPAKLTLPGEGILEVDAELRDRFDVDAVPLSFYPKQWRDWRSPEGIVSFVPELWRPEALPTGELILKDAGGVVRQRKPPKSPYFESVNPPLAGIDGAAELAQYEWLLQRWDWPPIFDESVDAYGERAKRLYDSTDRAVVALWRLHFLQSGLMLRGFEQFYMDLLANEPLVHALFRRLLDIYLERTGRFLEVMKDSFDIIFITDDLGTQGGAMIDPRVFRKMVRPYMEEMFLFLKKRSGGKPILLHSCGAVHAFIPDFIEMGVDALNPVQISAAGMDPVRLKKDFGKDIAFWGGGCDTQDVLCNGTPEKVCDSVKRHLDIFAPGGGYVFTQVHNIQAGVPPENIVALYDTAREYGKY